VGKGRFPNIGRGSETKRGGEGILKLRFGVVELIFNKNAGFVKMGVGVVVEGREETIELKVFAQEKQGNETQ